MAARSSPPISIANQAAIPLRILFVTAAPPETGVGGGVTATRSFIDALRAPEIGAIVDIFPLRERPPKLPHRLRQFVALTRSATSRLSSKSLFDFSPAAERRLRAVDFTGYDLVIINAGELFFLADYLPADMPCIGLAHNVEGSLYEAQTPSLRRLPLIGRLFANDLEKLKHTELSGLRRIGRVICLSREDAYSLKKIYPPLWTLELPTTFSYTPNCREPNRRGARPLRLGFLAKYSWWPNVEAVEWMLGQVLPRLTPGSIELLLYGPGADRFNDRHPALKVRGFVQDLRQVWNESDIVICPMQSGSGINIKFIEAVYNQCPVLATSYATRGLPELRDPAIVCLDTPDEWIRFLSSDSAVDLARMSPRRETSATFSVESTVAKLARMLRAVHGSSATSAKLNDHTRK